MKFLFQRVLFGLIITLAACQRDDDEVEPPKIIVDTPFEGSVISSIDTIHFVGGVRAQNRIDRIEISLNQVPNQRIGTTINIFPGMALFDFNAFYFLDEPDLESGPYFFAVRAFDGDVEGSAFINVNVAGIPITKKGAIVLSTTLEASQLDWYDNDFINTPIANVNGDLLGSGINSRDQQVYTIGATKGDLVAFDIASGNKLWTKAGSNNPGQPFFTGFGTGERSVYYGSFDGSMQAINQAGIATFTTNAQPGFVGEQFIEVADKVVTIERNITSGAYHLAVYFAFSGDFIHKLALADQPHGIFPVGMDRVMVVGQEAGASFFQHYDLVGNFFTFPRETITGSVISNVVQGSESEYFYSNAEGLFRFSTVHSESNVLFPGVNSEHLDFDRLNREIWSGSGTEVSIYAVDQPQLVHSFSHFTDIKGLHVVDTR